MAETSIIPTNTVPTIARSLYKLHGALTGAEFKSIVTSLPSLIKDTILPALKAVIDKVHEVVSQFLNAETLKKIQGVIQTGLDVVGSTMDLLPETVQRSAEVAQRFLTAARDFISADGKLITAIIDMLGKIGSALDYKNTADTALTTATTDTLKPLLA